jgi:uncharacterized protein YuzE
MKLTYYPDTDTLYIDLAETSSVESDEVADGVVLDFDGAGNVVGVEIDKASTKVALQRLVLTSLPGEIQTIVA